MRILGLYRHLCERCRYFVRRPEFQSGPLRAIWRLLVWRLRCWLRWPATISLPAWQARMVLPPWWGAGGTTLFYLTRENYEPEVTHLGRLLPAGGVFVDGGANLGIYTVAAASLVGPAGKVVAFEPQPKVFRALEKNIAANRFSWVDLRPIALSDREGEAQLFSASEGAVYASFGKWYDSRTAQSVRTTTLDAALAGAGLQRLDVLKLDVEGAEELILRGAAQTLVKHRPKVIFEINPPAIAALGLALNGTWRILEEQGYRFFRVDADGSFVPTLLPERGGNVVALPGDGTGV